MNRLENRPQGRLLCFGGLHELYWGVALRVCIVSGRLPTRLGVAVAAALAPPLTRCIGNRGAGEGRELLYPRITDP